MLKYCTATFKFIIIKLVFKFFNRIQGLHSYIILWNVVFETINKYYILLFITYNV